MKDKNLQKLLLDINEDLLKEVIALLEPIDAATRLVSQDKEPTLHLIVAIRLNLIKRLSDVTSQLEPVTELSYQLETLLKKKFVIGDLHNIALLLDPRLKDKHGMQSGEDRERALISIRVMVQESKQNSNIPGE